MILRRVIQHFRKQEWTAIAIDFLIVVAGVFVGIQVSNWNAARQERASEKAYLGYLAEDVRADISVIGDVLKSTNRRLSALNAVIELATGRALPDAVYGRSASPVVGAVEPFEPESSYETGTMLVFTEFLDGNRSAYETMISTGAIGTLRDPSLARKIQAYYAKVDLMHRFEERLLFFRNELVTAEYGAGFSWIDEMTIDAIAQKAAGDERLLSAMKGYWEFTVRHRRLLRDIAQAATALERAIMEETAQ